MEHFQSADQHRCFIRAYGAVCSLGRSAVPAFTAARAGIARISTIETLNLSVTPGFGRETLDGPPQLKGHAVPEIGSGYSGRAKLLALAVDAWRDLRDSVSADPSIFNATQKIFIAMSNAAHRDDAARIENGEEDLGGDRPSELWRRDLHDFPQQLIQRLAEPTTRSLQIVLGDNEAFATALMAAAQYLRESGNKQCIVGAIDSCLDTQSLVAFDTAGRLKNSSNSSGFIPGEAAVFLLLSSECGSEETSTAIDHVVVRSATENQEEGPGVALASVLTKAIPAGDNGYHLITNLNGEDRTAYDWGNAIMRLNSNGRYTSLPLTALAASFGEVGAAHAALATAYACFWMRRCHSGSAVVGVSSHSGTCAAISLKWN